MSDPVPESLPVPANVKGSPLTTAKNYDPRVKARALELYLTTELTLTDIAIELETPERAIATWARQDNWIAKREALELEFLTRAENSYRRFMAEKRTDVAQRHERIAAALEKAIEDTVTQRLATGNVTDATLKRLAEALSSVTGVSARAVGIGTATSDLARRQEEVKGQQRQPLVIIGVGAALPPETSIKVVEGVTNDG